MPRHKSVTSRPRNFGAVSGRDGPFPRVPGQRGRQIAVPVEEWEQPERSHVWREAGFLMLSVSAAAAFVALALSEDVAIRAPELWTITGCALILAVGCFLANHDVNRGRIPKRYIRFEEAGEDFADGDQEAA